MAHILIVDDQPHIIRVLQFTLERAGHRVVTASNGREALARVEERAPDVLITDVMMPQMTGRELCLAIHERYPDRTFPILVMTSLTDRSEREWVRKINGVEFMEKPVSPRDLLDRVQARSAQLNEEDKQHV